MKIAKLIVPLLLAMILPSTALALDASAAIKVTTLLKTTTSWDGQPIVYPSGQAEVTGMLIEIAPGGETSWHLHPVPSFCMVLDGELEVQLKNGTFKRFKSGDAFAEVMNTLHHGHNVGTVPVKLVVFYAGSVGKKLSETEHVQ
jgi:quercetin dioxygenase-like cupin family protein